jgi:hypothetical protein
MRIHQSGGLPRQNAPAKGICPAAFSFAFFWEFTLAKFVVVCVAPQGVVGF